MSQLIETTKNKEPYWQAIGVLRGTLKASEPAKEKAKNQIFSLIYHGREYPILPSRNRFEQQKDFDLGKERLYLVYPRPRAQKAYHLLKKDYGKERAETLSFIPNGIKALHHANGWSQNFINDKIPQLMKGGNLERLFSVNRIPEMEDSKLAYATFKLLKGVLHHKNEVANDQEKIIAQQVVGLLNKAVCDQLYHPQTEDVSSSFLRSWIQSSCLNTELDRWAKGMLLDTMSFTLVAYSDADGDEYLDKDGNSLEQSMFDGEFILSGHWKRWRGEPLVDNKGDRLLDERGKCIYMPIEERPSKATFTSYLNKDVVRNFKRTPLGAEDPKHLIIFLDRDKPEILDKCYGRAIASLSPKLNVFNLEEFVETDRIPSPLTSKNLVAKQKATKSHAKGSKLPQKTPKNKTN